MPTTPMEGDSDPDIREDVSKSAAVGTKRTVPTTVSDSAPDPEYSS